MANLSIDKTNLILLDLVAKSLHPKTDFSGVLDETVYQNADWSAVYSVASAAKVTPMIYDVVAERNDVPDHIMECFKRDALQMIQVNYKLWLTTRFICKKFEEADISVVVLKGPVVSALFPTPEYRKSGDIDLVVPASDMQKAGEILQELGYVFERETAPHIEYANREGIEVEVHRLMSEPMPDEKVNKFLEELVEKGLGSRTNLVFDTNLSFPVFPDEINAFELVIHMLSHFHMGGFGIRLLCDWVAFLEANDSHELVEKVSGLIEEIHVKNFVSVVTYICVKYLGLSKDKASLFLTEKVDDNLADNMLHDILQAKEFGFSNDRGMVALSDSSFVGLVKGFHHQMKCNHPKSSKCVLLWPILWVITLVVFVRNNKKIRKVKTFDVIKKAMKRADSVNAGSLQIFKN